MLEFITKRTTDVMISIGATILALMMYLTVLDVGLRYIFQGIVE